MERKLKVGDLVVNRFEYNKLGMLERTTSLPPAGVITNVKRTGIHDLFLVSWSESQYMDQYWYDIDLKVIE